jgi:TonB family protein
LQAVSLRTASRGTARNEPLLLPALEAAPPRFLSTAVAITDDFAAGRPEPAPATAVPAAPLPERAPPIGSVQRRRPFGPLASLILHLLPLLLLIDWTPSRPTEVMPIPVRLVLPPPPPPPKPKPKAALPKPEVKPPPGRLASEDIGETKTSGHEAARSEAEAAGEKPAATETSPPRPEQQTAAIIPPPPVPGASGLPNEEPAQAPPRPKPKPRVPGPLLRRTEARLHFNPRPARFPGPAATRDEYLAYLVYLTRQHLNLLPLSVVGGRHGETVLDILVLDNGTLARVDVLQSSGYPEIDRRIEAMIRAVGRFPPLPQWFQGPSMPLEFKLIFPEALED